MSSPSSSSVKVVLTAVGGNFCVMIAKFTGFFFSGSPSMLAEGIHSTADVTNQLLLFLGIKQSQGSPTKKYPYGKGQAQYLWNLISAVGIFFIGFGVTTYHGISSLFHAHQAVSGSFNLVMGILLFSFIVEMYTLYVAWVEVKKAKGKMGLVDYIKKGNDPTSVAVLLEDAIAVLGVILATIGLVISKFISSGLPDAIASILIGCLLGAMAVMLSLINGRLLMDQSAPEETEEEIREFLESQAIVERVVQLRTVIIGVGKLKVSMEIEFHGSSIIDPNQIARDKAAIDSGESVTKVLTHASGRMVRVVGTEINRLEIELQKQFPNIVAIELEVN